jgi:hypothetical protein
LFVGLSAEIPGGKTMRGQFGFSVSRRDQQHQAIDFAALDAL